MKIDWVPVSVTLPDSDMEVIVATEGMTAAGFHDGHVWRWTCAARIKTNVTHWAHMPEPPEELTLGTVGGGREMKQLEYAPRRIWHGCGSISWTRK